MYYQEAVAYTCQWSIISEVQWKVRQNLCSSHTCTHSHLHNHNWVTSCPVKIIPCYPAIYRSLLQTDQSLMLLPFACMRMILLWFFGSLIILHRRSIAPWTRPRLNVWLDASRQMWHPPWGNESSMKEHRILFQMLNRMKYSSQSDAFPVERTYYSGLGANLVRYFKQAHNKTRFWPWHSPKYSISSPGCFKVSRAISVK